MKCFFFFLFSFFTDSISSASPTLSPLFLLIEMRSLYSNQMSSFCVIFWLRDGERLSENMKT